MFTVGVDLSAESKGTAVAQIEWLPNRARLINLHLGAADELIVELAKSSEKTGIDCALGWPVDFANFINDHVGGNHELTPDFGSSDWRRKLSYRETDRVVRSTTGRWPLSVATDRLGVTALRCAGLVARLRAAGLGVAREGTQGIVEIYPAPSMKIWGFETAGYRDSPEIRLRLVAYLRASCPWLDLGDHADLMVKSCDAFDAVIACLAARSAAIGSSTMPDDTQLGLAKLEGWISLPKFQISKLVGEPDLAT
jgi:predicted nuclease with RNAse H fold